MLLRALWPENTAPILDCLLLCITKVKHADMIPTAIPIKINRFLNKFY